jgi:hypothetical protein
LEKGYLEAIQLAICTDSSRPTEVLECYTFAFTYARLRGHSSREVSSISISPSCQNLVLVGDARKNFNTAIKGLLKSIRGLPQLPRQYLLLATPRYACSFRPGRRHVGLSLFYTTDCPSPYEPTGFSSCTDDALYFPDDHSLARESEDLSDLTTGAHCINLVVSYVRSKADDVKLRLIPEHIEYTNKRSRLDEYKKPNDRTTSQGTRPLAQPLLMSSQPLCSDSMIPSAIANSTQTREDIETRKALQQMQCSSPRPNELTATQSLAIGHDADSEGSRPGDQSRITPLPIFPQTATRREKKIIPRKMAELITQAKVMQKRSPVDHPLFDPQALESCEIKRIRQSSAINCECMDVVKEGVMVCDPMEDSQKYSLTNDSSSVTCARPGNTSLATAGIWWARKIVPSITTVMAVCFYPVSRTCAVKCRPWSREDLRSSTSMRMGLDLKETRVV